MEQKKITALGDSLTRGVGLNESNRYSVLNGSFIDFQSYAGTYYRYYYTFRQIPGCHEDTVLL